MTAVTEVFHGDPKAMHIKCNSIIKYNKIDTYLEYLQDKSNIIMAITKPTTTPKTGKRASQKSPKTKALRPVADYMPTLANYKELVDYNVTVSFLKSVAKHYKLKVSGNKNELLQKIYAYFHYSWFALRLQRIYRGYLLRRLLRLQGAGLRNRKLCTNSTDFITFEDLKDIPAEYFYSFEINRPISRKTSLGSESSASAAAEEQEQEAIVTYNHKEVYGFNITSIYNYVVKKRAIRMTEEVLNPYTRDVLPLTIRKDLETVVRLSRIVGRPLNMMIEDEVHEISATQQLELRALALFQNINELDNYSDAGWFLGLSREGTLRFVRELHDIWNHRAQLTAESKCEIYPPDGNLFRGTHVHHMELEVDLVRLKKTVLGILERFINSTATVSNRKLAAIYVLSALTLVSTAAADAMPLYYFSVLEY